LGAASVVVKCYGDLEGAAMWHRILKAIERLQAMAPADDEKVH
jgi:hypothetical protein